MDEQVELFPDHQSARAAAAAGIATAVRNADLQSEHWSDRARGYVTDYARENGAFTAEEVRVWARDHAKPPLVTPDTVHPRAWGAVMQAAAKAGTIVDTGERVWSKVRPANAGYRVLWRSLVTHADVPRPARDPESTVFHLSIGEGKVACGAHRRMRSAAARAALIPAEDKRGVTCLRCKGTSAYERAK